MSKSSSSIVFLVIIVAIVIGAVFIIHQNNVRNIESERISQINTENKPEEVEELVVEEGPISFSKIGIGIMDAKEKYSYFSFENGSGTCMEQGFPTNMIYTSENIVKTADNTYIEDYTSVDFMGYISFDSVPLSTGSASCLFETSLDSDIAKVDCRVDEVSVCTATFDLFGHL